MSAVPAGGSWPLPSRSELFEWLGQADPGTGPGDVYDLALETSIELQGQVCVWTDYTSTLHAAALRRAARFLAARGLALSRLDQGEFGSVYLPRWDAEIETYEAEHRIGGFA